MVLNYYKNFIILLVVVFLLSWKVFLSFCLLAEVDFFIMSLFIIVIYMIYIKTYVSVLIMLNKLVLNYQYKLDNLLLVLLELFLKGVSVTSVYEKVILNIYLVKYIFNNLKENLNIYIKNGFYLIKNLEMIFKLNYKSIGKIEIKSFKKGIKLYLIG